VPFHRAALGEVAGAELAAVDLGQEARAVAFQRQHQGRLGVQLARMAQQAGQGAFAGQVLLPARRGLHRLRLAGRDLDQVGVVVGQVDQGHHVGAARGHLQQAAEQRVLGELLRFAVGEAAEHGVGAEGGVDHQGHVAGGVLWRVQSRDRHGGPFRQVATLGRMQSHAQAR